MAGGPPFVRISREGRLKKQALCLRERLFCKPYGEQRKPSLLIRQTMLQ